MADVGFVPREWVCVQDNGNGHGFRLMQFNVLAEGLGFNDFVKVSWLKF